MLTGNKPYHSTDPFATALMHINDPIPQLPEPFVVYQDILNHLLAKEPQDRYPNTETLIKAFKQIRSTPAPTNAEEVTRVITPVVTPKPIKAPIAPEIETIQKTTAAPEKVSVPDIPIGIPAEPHPSPPKKRFIHLTWLLLIPLLGGGAYYLFQQQIQDIISRWGEQKNGEVPIPPTPELDEQDRLAIASFLENAGMLADMGDLIAPSGTNAVSIYCRALALDPSNLEARAGLDAVAANHQEQPQTEAMENELKDTLTDIEDCLKQAPKHPGLLQLHKQITQLLKDKNAL